MALARNRQELHLIKAGDGTSTGTVARHACVTRPFYLRRVGAMVVVAGTTTALKLTVKKRVTPGTDTGGTTIGTLTMPSATSVAGTAIYLDDLNTLINYGDEVYVAVTTAGGGSLTFDCTLEIEDVPSNPQASSALTKVTE